MVIDSLLASFLGSFHPLVVHLPTGILLVAIGIDARTSGRPNAPLRVSLPVLYGTGAASAVLACISGYLLVQDGGYDDTLADRHQWLALSTAFISVLQWLRVSGRLGRQIPVLPLRLLPVALFVLLLFAAHYGGSLTHGNDYLLKSAPGFLQRIAGYSPGDEATLQVTDVQQAGAYKDLASVILQKKCVSCHGPGKQKGGLRLDGPDWIRKGGKNGGVLVAGNPGGSEMIKRILLPLNDDDHMPPEGKNQLSKQEIAYLHWWISQGGDFDKQVRELAQSDSIRTMLTSFETGSKANGGEELPPEPLQAADGARTDSLEKLGILILPLAEGSRNLEVSLINCTGTPDSMLQLLEVLSPQVVSLHVSGKKVTDTGLVSIGRLTRLRKLNLGQSLLTDMGLRQLSGLKDLRYLNLTHTRITAAGLGQLRELPNLRSLYLSGTGIKKEDWPGLIRQFKDVYLDSGGYRLPMLATDTERVKEGKRK